MKFVTTTLLLLMAGSIPALAQDDAASSPMPGPAPQLDRLNGLLGEFEGGGSFVMAPDGEPMNWTSKAYGKRVLGGHVLQVEEVIQTPIGPMEFCNLYSWDAQRERLVSYSISPNAIVSMDLFWLDDETLVTVGHGTEEGQPYADRSTTRFSNGRISFTMERMVGTDAPFEMVKGDMVNMALEDPDTAEASSAAQAPSPVDPGPVGPMAALAPMIGAWNVAGHVNMMGMEMDVTAKESVEWSMGSTVMAGSLVGESGDYQAEWYLTFDAQAGIYRQVYASSMGEIGMTTGLLVDDQLILTEANVTMGQPTVMRSVVQFKDGGISNAWTDSFSGAGDSVRAFEATYARALAFTPGSCCAKAEAAGAACSHPCCVTAAEKGEVCERCNK